ncbi:11814_t:CDS:2 [Funneliformis geosporum]|nr:11814_t:CDS:2 [Funneliformis geosporum]
MIISIKIKEALVKELATLLEKSLVSCRKQLRSDVGVEAKNNSLIISVDNCLGKMAKVERIAKISALVKDNQ